MAKGLHFDYGHLYSNGRALCALGNGSIQVMKQWRSCLSFSLLGKRLQLYSPSTANSRMGNGSKARSKVSRPWLSSIVCFLHCHCGISPTMMSLARWARPMTFLVTLLRIKPLTFKVQFYLFHHYIHTSKKANTNIKVPQSLYSLYSILVFSFHFFYQVLRIYLKSY